MQGIQGPKITNLTVLYRGGTLTLFLIHVQSKVGVFGVWGGQRSKDPEEGQRDDEVRLE